MRHFIPLGRTTHPTS